MVWSERPRLSPRSKELKTKKSWENLNAVSHRRKRRSRTKPRKRSVLLRTRKISRKKRRNCSLMSWERRRSNKKRLELNSRRWSRSLRKWRKRCLLVPKLLRLLRSNRRSSRRQRKNLRRRWSCRHNFRCSLKMKRATLIRSSKSSHHCTRS